LVALDERLHATALVGMALTLAGVAWVVLERPPSPLQHERRRIARGVSLALLAAMCQAGGLLLSKQGMGHGWLPKDQHLSPQAATLVRMVFGGLGMVPMLLVYVTRRHHRHGSENSMTMGRSAAAGFLFAACGAVTGPFLGVWMSLTACNLAPLGVAQTLCSLAPILILPCVAILKSEPLSPRAICGALVAVGGTALLFLAGS
jgi:drug/metabolite transporter (DMT)-like permease